MAPESFDCRSARPRRDLEHRGGPRFSADEDNAPGRLPLMSPIDGASLRIPDVRDMPLRLSLFPRQVNFYFDNEKMFRRLSFIQLEGNRCMWADVVYGTDLFPPDIRDVFG